MATTIVTKNSSTASAVPTAAQLVQGELAVNVADKRIYTENNAGAVVELGTNPSTLTVTGEITANGGIALGDNDKATFGAGDDLQIYSDGTNAIIKEDTGGSLYIGGADIHLMNPAFTEYYISAAVNGAVTLRHDNATKLSTTATGIDVTGNLQATGYLAVDGASGNTGAGTDRWIGGDGTAGTWFYNVPTGSSHYFAVNNTNKLAINSTGIDVTGTATMDGLTVDGESDLNATVTITHANPRIKLIENDTTNANTQFSNDAGDFAISTMNDAENVFTKRFNLDHATGDISFYEDTGTTPKLFWDASTESLGIGTSSPASGLHVVKGVADVLRLERDATNQWQFQLTGGALAFRDSTSNQERMRIDSSGNLLVGTTDANPTNNSTNSAADRGIAFSGGQGWIANTTYNETTAYFNRTGTDGTIIDLIKSGTTVGSIGVEGGDLVIGTGSTAGLQFNDATPTVRPWNMSANSRTDGVCDLGYSNARFKDLYLSGGVYLGGTGAANKLDDYEEGTCTLTLTGTTSAPTVAQTATGTYTKVGNTVTVFVTFGNKDVTGVAGNVNVTGFPFTTGGGEQLGHFSNSRGDPAQYAGYMPASGTAMFQINYAGSALAWASTGTGTYAFITVTYITT